MQRDWAREREKGNWFQSKIYHQRLLWQAKGTGGSWNILLFHFSPPLCGK